MDTQELKQRTFRFALRIIRLVQALPSNGITRPLGHQLVRSGTSVGANYRSACKSRSRAEFIARLGVAEEEADESAYWLELLIDSKQLQAAHVQPLLQEATELTAILAASRKTAKHNRKSTIGNRKSPSPSLSKGATS
ncbi:four helix bundle protein [bacterium]|nr:four helix bundle protein [bacterium]